MADHRNVTANRLFERRTAIVGGTHGRHASQPISARGVRARTIGNLGLSGHLDALISALREGGAEVFAEHCAWASVLTEGLGGSIGELDTELRVLREELATLIDRASAAVAATILDAGRDRLRAIPIVTPPSLAVIASAPVAIRASAAAALDAGAARVATMAVVLGHMRRPATAIAHREHGVLCLEDMSYHLAQLAAAASEDEPELFADYAEWARSVVASANRDPAEMARDLGDLQDAIEIVLPSPLASTPRRCVAAALERLHYGVRRTPSFISTQKPMGELAERWLSALLRAKRDEACRMILDAVEAGAPVPEVYRHVFLPAQHELGRLWQVNEISVAQEHYGTAVTQLAMSLLYPRVMRGERTGRRLLSTCAGGNLHEIGSRFVADFFEMAGWDTFYIGASAPTADILRELVARDIHVLAISAALVSQLRATRELIAAVRGNPACRDVAILVGGYPFRVTRDLWARMGADGSARDAEGAVALATKLCRRRP